MVKHFLNTKIHWTYFVSLICLLWLFILTFGTATGTDIEGQFINSDTLYLPSLYWDLFENGNAISDWNLNPAPNFFPDMLFYFLLMKLTGSLLISSFLFSVFQLLFMNLLFRSILKKITVDYSKILIIGNLLLALFALAELVSDQYLFVFYFLSNSYHLGSFILTLLALNCVLSFYKTKSWWNLPLLFLVCFLGGVSDKLFLIGFTFPIISVFLVYFLPKKKTRIEWYILGTNVLSTIGGFLILRVLTHNKILFIEDPNSFLNVENIIPSMMNLFEQYKFYLLEFNVISLIFVLAFISFLLLTYYCFKCLRVRGKEIVLETFFVLFGWFSIAYVIISPVLAGNYTGFDTIRYNYHAYIFLIVLFPFLIYKIGFFNSLSLKKTAIFSTVMLCVLALGFSVFSSYNFSNYFNLYPKKVAITDAYSKKTGLKTGTSDYWSAKLITMFSKEEVFILPVYTDLGFYDHATNRNWCHVRPGSQGATTVLEFTLLDPFDSATVVNVLPPNSVNYETFKGLTFVQHPKYIYNWGNKIDFDLKP